MRLSQPLIAPAAKDNSGCSTTRSGSNTCRTPKPSHTGQEPIGLLNENKRGSNSGRLYAQCGQENFAENSISSPVSIFTATALSLPKRKAVSKLSAKRCLLSLFTFRRSITTSMVCLMFFSNFGVLSNSTILPSKRTRTKPCVCRSANKSTNSPLRSFTAGAKIIILVFSGKDKTLSTICDTVWDDNSSPCSGQIGVPTRANKSRK